MSKKTSLPIPDVVYPLFSLLILATILGVFSAFTEKYREEEITKAKASVEEMVLNAKGSPFFYLSKSETGIDDVYVNMMGETKRDLNAEGGNLVKCNVYVDGSVSKPQVISVGPGFERVETHQQMRGKGSLVQVENYKVEKTETILIRNEFPKMCDILIGRSPADPIDTKTPVSLPAGWGK